MLCVCARMSVSLCMSVCLRKKKQKTVIYIDSSLRLQVKILYLSLPYINKAILGSLSSLHECMSTFSSGQSF